MKEGLSDWRPMDFMVGEADQVRVMLIKYVKRSVGLTAPAEDSLVLAGLLVNLQLLQEGLKGAANA